MTKWMKHPNLEATIEVPDAAVIGHMLSGWRLTDPPPPPKTLEDILKETPGAGAEPGAKYAAAVESRPENHTELDGKEK